VIRDAFVTRKRTGRPPKHPSDRKSHSVSFMVEPGRLDAYRSAAANGFNGNLADFLRAAADTLVTRLSYKGVPIAGGDAVYILDEAEV
jgi:hypothetical protein